MPGFNNYKKTGTGPIIGLIVEDQYGIEVFFTIKSSNKLKKLLNVYCDQQFVDFNYTSFLFDGRSIRGEQTPHELQMEEGDKIYAILHQSEEQRVYYDQQLAINIALEEEIIRLRKGLVEDAKKDYFTKIVLRSVNQLFAEKNTLKEELKEELIRLKKDEGEDAALIKIGRDVYILLEQLLEENLVLRKELNEEMDKVFPDDDDDDDDEDEVDDECFISIGRIVSGLIG